MSGRESDAGTDAPDLHRVVRTSALEGPLDLAAFAEHTFADAPHIALLESLGPPSRIARWSFLCADPFLVFTSKRGQAFAGPPDALAPLPGDPLAELAALLKRYGADPSPPADDEPPFRGGAVGYLGYEVLHLLANVPDVAPDEHAVADIALLFCSLVFAFDAHAKRTWISATGFGSTQAEAASAAEAELARGLARAQRAPPAAPRPSFEMRRAKILAERPSLGEGHLLALGIAPALRRDAYLDVVARAREHIFAGDVFEVCTANAWRTTTKAPGPALYRTLSGVSPAPFAAYLRFPEVEVISSSPERFVRLDHDRWAETRPIKGTRPRGRTPDEDARLRADLASSPKDNAENVMIVDVSRNDLGRVCAFHTVTVPELRVVESYPFTHQLVSTIRGRLSPEHGVVDLVRACFPGGSMTGAPKIQSMKVIAELEPVQRGIFSGAIAYFDFDGAFDSSIVIRTFVKKGEHVSFHVGGAIVADSDPDAEFQETLDKAHALVTALELASEPPADP